MGGRRQAANPGGANASRRSKRLRADETRRGLDPETVKRRTQRALANLERDNFIEDPQPELPMPVTYGQQSAGGGASYSGGASHSAAAGGGGGGRAPRRRANNLQRMRIADYFKTRFAKTLQQLIDDAVAKGTTPNYATAQAPPPAHPPRHFCVVCGFFAKYTCVTCSARHCSIKCHEIHVDTRCLKWVV